MWIIGSLFIGSDSGTMPVGSDIKLIILCMLAFLGLRAIDLVFGLGTEPNRYDKWCVWIAD